MASITKRGLVSRVTCPKCGTRSSFSGALKAGAAGSRQSTTESYDRRRTYRAGQMIVHPMWGQGEVTAVIEPRKIDVLFSDRLRRLIHSRQEVAGMPSKKGAASGKRA